jgi:hypothetical protein
MTNREPGRHTRRAVEAMRESQLATVAGTMTTEQLRAALLTVIHADARLAQTAIDAAIEQHPIQQPPRFLPAATMSFGDWVLAGGNPAEYGWRTAAPIEGDGNHPEPGSGEA